MAFAVTQNCCTDASCVSVCPVNCIHPTPDEPDFGRTELLYVDPRSCIDCGACADACPVDAITSVARLAPRQREYAEINADYYRDRPVAAAWDQPRFPPPGLRDIGRLRVAVVGSGPAACYAAQELLRGTDARVTMFERLTVPGGLARFGVAPDHLATRQIAEHFGQLFGHPRLTLRLGVEVGVGITHEQLRARYDAVIYAVGAATDRTLGIAGEQLPGSLSARTVVGWYNGHPDVPADAVDLSGVQRVVLVGNGNVAIDAARILTADPSRLAGTDIAPHALAALRAHRVGQVVLVARRGPEAAAFTRSECRALRYDPDVEVLVADGPGVREQIAAAGLREPASALAGARVVDPDWRAAPTGRSIVFAFGLTPAAITGTDRVEGLRVAGPDHPVDISAQLVLRAIGYRGCALPGLPFDPATGTVPHVGGRVHAADGSVLAGTYVVGWIKRGPTGGLGTNRTDAQETVGSLLADATTGRLGAAVAR